MQQPLSGAVPAWAWAVFGAVVLLLLGVELWSAAREEHPSKTRALVYAILWIALGLGFGAFVRVVKSARLAQEYFGAYAMEEGLSLDNMFLFYVIFKGLNIPEQYHRKVLMWGVLGAVVLRGLFIFIGISAVSRWDWVSYVFAVTLVYAAWRAFRKDPARQEKSRAVEWLSRHLPVKQSVADGQFFARQDDRRLATPLFLALIAIELSDLVFAIDSVPAALSITHNRFIVYTSNVFAVLGLRSLYLYLAAVITRLPYLHYGLAAVLAFAAVKIALDDWIRIPPLVSIVVEIGLIGGAVLASLHVKRKRTGQQSLGG